MLPIPVSPIHNLQTPLRYPGGKSALFGFVRDVISECGVCGCEYIEPFAGGAGLALRLLVAGVVSSVVINDLDPLVYSFWKSAVDDSTAFLELFDSTEVTMEEWHRQKQLIRSSCDRLVLGFAFFFLNRTNRSGIIDGGVIGGLAQGGTYKIDARYNKKALRKKLEFLGEQSSSIRVSREDGCSLVRRLSDSRDSFLFIDPPYVQKGGSLYMNAMSEKDHQALSEVLNNWGRGNWLLTYDDDQLVRSLYEERICGMYRLGYSAYRRRKAAELMIASDPVREAVLSCAGRKELHA